MRPRFCNCERIRRSIRSSLLSVLIAAGSVSHVGGRSMLSRSRARTKARCAFQCIAHVALREYIVECLREALEQHVEVRFGITKRGREAENVIAECAEHEAVCIGCGGNAVGQLERCIEAALA